MTRHLLIDYRPRHRRRAGDPARSALARRARRSRHHRRRQRRGGSRDRECPAHPRGRRARSAAAAGRRRPGPAQAARSSPRTRCMARTGSGNLERFVEPSGQPRYPEPTYAIEMRTGPEVILDAADRWGAELTIVALGPLTNLALALQQDPRRLGRAGRIVVMGGRDRGAGQRHAGRRVQLLRGSGGGRGRARGRAPGGAGAARRDAPGGARAGGAHGAASPLLRSGRPLHPGLHPPRLRLRGRAGGRRHRPARPAGHGGGARSLAGDPRAPLRRGRVRGPAHARPLARRPARDSRRTASARPPAASRWTWTPSACCAWSWSACAPSLRDRLREPGLHGGAAASAPRGRDGLRRARSW